MPKSKRQKIIHLSKVDKKGKELTLKLFAGVRESLDRYSYCYVFEVANMRNTYLKDVRAELADSRLFFGKTKVMAKALGHAVEDEHLSGSAALSKHLHGPVGLLFTSRTPADVAEYFAALSHTDFARAGCAAARTFVIPEGMVYATAGEVPVEEDMLLSHTLEPELRKLGVPTRLDRGKVVNTMEGGYTVCEEGKTLDSRQTRLLKMFGVEMAEFRVRLVAYLTAATGEVTELEGAETDEDM